MKLTKANGVVVEGTPEECVAFVRAYERKCGGEEFTVAAEVKSLPKIGEKIRVVGNGAHGAMGPHGFDVGEIVEVTGHSPKNKDRVHARSGIDSWWVHVEDFEITKQLTRAAVVARAKRDVDGGIPKEGCTWDGIKGYSADCYVCDVEFIVNREKRTVVALMRGVHGNDVYAKGIAKCSPDDVFNAHIGKAIALRRALGLDVPDEYTCAPKPKGVEVGDVFKVTARGSITGKSVTIKSMDPSYDGSRYGTAFRHSNDSGWLGEKQGVVIDDTDRRAYAD